MMHLRTGWVNNFPSVCMANRCPDGSAVSILNHHDAMFIYVAFWCHFLRNWKVIVRTKSYPINSHPNVVNSYKRFLSVDQKREAEDLRWHVKSPSNLGINRSTEAGGSPWKRSSFDRVVHTQLKCLFGIGPSPAETITSDLSAFASFQRKWKQQGLSWRSWQGSSETVPPS